MLSLYPKGIQARKKQKNKQFTSRSVRLLDDAADAMDQFNQAIHVFKSMFDSIGIVNANLNQVLNSLSVLPSRVDTFTYKVDQIQRDVQNLQSSIMHLQNLQYMTTPFVNQINAASKEIASGCSDFNEELLTFKKSFKELETVMNDPSMRRTIDELTEISSRYDSILD
jgi:DNA repair ATPase RecN